MSMLRNEIIPDPEALLALEPEEIAGFLISYLNSLPEKESSRLSLHNFILSHAVRGYPQNFHEKAIQAFIEAWSWLVREGLLASRDGSWFFITRRGQRLKETAGLEAYRQSNLLPKSLLHPLIGKVWANFLRGDYETAVFQAFKEVEVAIRNAGKFSFEEYGVPLVRKAFADQNGPLTDGNLPEGERAAMGHLFAGAIGLYKNPSSHRHVSIKPEEAVEMLLLASHLLRIIDSRSGASWGSRSDGPLMEHVRLSAYCSWNP